LYFVYIFSMCLSVRKEWMFRGCCQGVLTLWWGEGVSLRVINIRGVCVPLAIINQYTQRMYEIVNHFDIIGQNYSLIINIKYFIIVTTSL